MSFFLVMSAEMKCAEVRKMHAAYIERTLKPEQYEELGAAMRLSALAYYEKKIELGFDVQHARRCLPRNHPARKPQSKRQFNHASWRGLQIAASLLVVAIGLVVLKS